MKDPIEQETVRKVPKLAQLPEEARRCRFAVSSTRLTVLKGLCQQPEVANRFVTHLAQRTRQRVREKAKRPGHLAPEEWARGREMIDRAVTALARYLDRPSEEGRLLLGTLFQELEGEQNAGSTEGRCA